MEAYQIHARVLKICSEEIVINALIMMWQLSKNENMEDVLSGIRLLPLEIRKWLADQIRAYFEDDDDGHEYFYAGALLSGQVVMTNRVPKNWVRNVLDVLESGLIT